MTYEWRDHPGFKPPTTLPADRAAAELERVRESNGGKLTPKDVVNEARPKTAVLHPCFEWKDAVAGELYREHQARNLIRAVRVVRDESPDSVPMFVHVKAESSRDQAYYQSAEVAVSNTDEWVAAVAGLEAKLTAAKRALDDLARIAGERGVPGAQALVVISKAFATIDHALDGLKH